MHSCEVKQAATTKSSKTEKKRKKAKPAFSLCACAAIRPNLVRLQSAQAPSSHLDVLNEGLPGNRDCAANAGGGVAHSEHKLVALLSLQRLGQAGGVHLQPRKSTFGLSTAMPSPDGPTPNTCGWASLLLPIITATPSPQASIQPQQSLYLLELLECFSQQKLASLPSVSIIAAIPSPDACQQQ